jgi:glycosyltransferase involved in cell wall biosynthesis
MRVARPCRHGGPKGLAVGLDARTLASEVHSGVEEYVINLVSALSRLTEAPEIIAYVDRPIPDPEIAQAASSGPLRTSIVRARRGWLRAALPWRLWRDRVNLVHLPSTILPPLLPCPAVVTVHDLAWVRYPETYEPKDLVMQRRAVAGAAARASHIIAVSDSTARDLRQHYPRSGDRVSVIPLGVSPQFSPDGLRLSSAAFPGAERLTRGYVLYAGGLQPRKNLLRLLVAYQKVLAETSAPPLVLAGAVSPHAHELRQAAQRLGIERHVVFPGYVAQDLLPALYRSATVFVYPSLYEGFGLPVLEAMACGVPVVTSNVSALPEVAGEAALLVDPESVERLSWAVSLLLADQALRQTLGQRGLARARQFTWEQTARQTVGVYQRFAAEE